MRISLIREFLINLFPEYRKDSKIKDSYFYLFLVSAYNILMFTFNSFNSFLPSYISKRKGILSSLKKFLKTVKGDTQKIPAV